MKKGKIINVALSLGAVAGILYYLNKRQQTISNLVTAPNLVAGCGRLNSAQSIEDERIRKIIHMRKQGNWSYLNGHRPGNPFKQRISLGTFTRFPSIGPARKNPENKSIL
ncbi:MAG: hypothetical protein NTY96_00285 [Bacteroidetes bacterium]|nr:hypothetical protein [Bacteroidota bacterium]